MLNDISKTLDPFLQEIGLDKYIARKWVYRGTSPVLDFDYRGVRFGCDITPLAGDRYHLNIVERPHPADFVAVATPDKRAVLADNASLEEAKELIRSRVTRLLSEIDAHFDSPAGQPGAAAPLPAATKPQKVGVLTLPLNANYGGNLQAFALMQALRKLGHAPMLVNLRHPGREASPAGTTIPLMAETVGLGQDVPNTSFTDTYLMPATRPFSMPEQLARNIGALGLDAVVAGSDQVWRPKFARSLLTNFYFFGFLPENSPVKRISYAPSFGVPSWEFTDEQTRRAAELVQRFDGVSVREDIAVDLCRQHLGVEPEHVVDPTMLLSPEDYVPVLSTAPRKRNPGQLLTYILDVTEDKLSALSKLSQALDRPAYGTNNLPFPQDPAADASGADKTVQGWLAAFHDAAFVVTDSFHGVAFSILFNKPFLAYGNPGRGMARFTSMLKMVGLEDRLVLNAAQIDVARMIQPIDWAAVNEKLAKRRAMSFEFLQRSLSAAARPAQPKAAAKPATTTAATAVSGAAEGIGPVLNIRPDFKTTSSTWTVARHENATVLSVAPEGAIVGNLVCCDFPSALEARAKYRITLDWALQTAESKVKPCIRNPVAGKNHIIGTVVTSPETSELHEYSLEFTVPEEGFTQLMLGGSSFTGKDGGAKIISIKLQKIAEPTAAPLTYADKARAFALRDSERFANAFTKGDAASLARTYLMYYTHAVEKGLSHMNLRAGFGKAAIERLSKDTESWLAAGRSPEDKFFVSAISVMHAYFKLHKELDFDVSAFWKLFSPRVQELISKADDSYGGVLEAAKEREPVPPASNQDRKFLDVIYGRRSIREFTDVPVQDADIDRAVLIGAQAPSVCNRQGPRVHHFKNPDQIRALIDLQGGFGGYKKPPTLLLVTCDLTAFTHAKERNQAFIDGGLFLMSLMLGLEQVGLGSCPLNTTMEADRESNIRRISKIPETEVLIAFIAVGHYDPAVLVPRSVRYPLEHLLSRHQKP